MVENIVNQITIGDLDSFYHPEKSKKKRGRRRIVDGSQYFKAVEKLLTTSDTKISRYLGVGRNTIWRFRTDPENAPVIEQAEKYIKALDLPNLTPSRMTWEIYQTLPVIRKWKDAMNRRMVGEFNQNSWMRSFYNLCKYMNVLPSQVSPEQCSKVVIEQRNRYYSDEPQIKGIAYSRIRESVRGYFMSVQNVSGMYLTNLGVSKEDLKGVGKYARQKVAQPVRHKFEDLLIDEFKTNDDIKYLDALGNSIFNFGTGTRVSASLEFDLQENYCLFDPHKWAFEIWDKGSKGKKKRWEKIIMGPVLDKFKDWISLRYDIPVRNLEDEIPDIKGSLFPSLNASKVRSICKAYLIKAGLPYRDFPPTHIWRHTFAQEMLWATDFNYELVASIGGWVNTMILKKHYGQMGEQARERGLLKAMGVKVPDLNKKMAW
jgi:hypothetical protein